MIVQPLRAIPLLFLSSLTALMAADLPPVATAGWTAIPLVTQAQRDLGLQGGEGCQDQSIVR